MWGDRAGGSQEKGPQNPGEVVSPGRKTSRPRLWRQVLRFEWALERGDIEDIKYDRLLHPVGGPLKIKKWKNVLNQSVGKHPVFTTELCGVNLSLEAGALGR